MRILLVEDSPRLQRSLSSGLQRLGFAVDLAPDGEQALRYARHNEYDVIVLDLLLPKVEGLTVLGTLREEGNDTHVLILTARDSVDDRIAGLHRGADDYLVKPFAFEELVARIEALVRRSYGSKSPVITVADLEIDTVARTVRRAGDAVTLTPREYALLEYLARRQGTVVSRTQIEEHLYDERGFPMSNAVDRIICTLRRKISADDREPVLHTRRGFGYLLDA